MPDLAILQTRLQNLKWSHILATLRVEDETARRWYLEAAAMQMWDVTGIHTCKKCHDRFLIMDGTDVYHIGASLKDLGKKMFFRSPRY